MNKNVLFFLVASATLSLASCNRPDEPIAAEVQSNGSTTVLVPEDDTVIVDTDNSQENQTVEVTTGKQPAAK